MVSIGDLPEDVLIEILSRLSVKSLVGLKCVCKFWYALITNPYFITTHLNRASSNTHNARILLRHRLNNDAAVSIFRYKSQGLCVDAQRIPWLDKGYLMSLHGPCDGIICVYRLLCGRPIALWNPATREFRALPRFSIAGPAGAEDLTLIGFGFDIRKKDYKVVRIVDFWNTETSNLVVDYPTQVEVYNLSSDSWRQIHTVVPTSHLAIRIRSYSAYLDGFYYWWAGESGVLSFDIDNEEFHEIPPPPDMGYYYDVVLVKCNGSITVISDNRENSEEPVFHIWVMNGNGVEKTWTKRSTIQHPVDLSPLGLLKSGEVLLYHKEEAWVASYDPRTQKLGILQFPLDALRICCQVFFYTESLVSIKGRNKAGLERIFSLIESFFEWLF